MHRPHTIEADRMMEVTPSSPLMPPDYPQSMSPAERDTWRVQLDTSLSKFLLANHSAGPNLEDTMSGVRQDFERQMAGRPAEEIEAAFQRATADFAAKNPTIIQQAKRIEEEKERTRNALLNVLSAGDPQESADILGLHLNLKVRQRTDTTGKHFDDVKKADRATAVHTRARLDLINTRLDQDPSDGTAISPVVAGGYAAIKGYEQEKAVAKRETSALFKGITESDVVLIAQVRQELILQRAEKLRAVVELDGAVKQALESWSFGADSDHATQADIHSLLEKMSAQINSLPQQEPEREKYIKSWVQLTVRYKQRQAFIGAEDTLPALDTAQAVIVNTPNGPVTMHDDGSISRNEMGHAVRRKPNGEVWLPPLEVAAPEPEFVEKIKALSDEDLKKFWQDAMQNWETNRTDESKVIAAHATRVHSERMGTNLNEAKRVHALATQAARAAENRLAEAAANFDNRVAERLAEQDDPYDPRMGERIRAEVMAHIKNLADIARVRGEAEETLGQQVGVQNARTNMANYWQGFVSTMKFREADGRPEQAATGPSGEKAVRILPDKSVARRQVEINGIRGDWVIRPDGSADLHDSTSGTVRTFNSAGKEVRRRRP